MTTNNLKKKSVMRKLLMVSLMVFSFGGLAACNKNKAQKAEYMVNKITKKLDLNDAQVKKLNVIKDKVMTLHEKKKDSKKEFHQKIKTLILSDKIDANEVKDLMAQRRNAIDEVLPEILPEVLEFHASLNGDQKKEIIEVMEKFKKKRGKHFKH